MPGRIALAAAAAFFLLGQASAKEPPAQASLPGDPEMAAAGREAQSTLPAFWRVFDAKAADKDSYFTVKAPFAGSGDGQVQMWLVVIRHDGETVDGVLVNEDPQVPNMHIRDRVTVKASEVTDWSYRKGGRNYGQFTTRIMLKHASAAVAAQVGATLWPTPLEPGQP
jgi:uncharacterized protein YegJ (DUF2314 family)